MTERPLDNADIERELYQLGLSDSPPRARRTLPTQVYQLTGRALERGEPFLYPSEYKFPTETARVGLERLRSLPPNTFLDRNVVGDVYVSPSEPWRGAGIRSSSAPSMPFERSLSYSEEALLLSGIGRLRGASQETRSLNDVEPTRRRSSSQGSANARNHARAYFNPHVSAAPPTSSVRQDPGGVHYPGYVELQDFLTLPRGPSDGLDDALTFDEEVEAEMIERQLIASVEAMLRRVHAGIQESYIHYEHPDSVAEPPPPQPVGATLRDPPPSPEPPHNHVSPPQPSYNGIRSNHIQRMQYTRGLPIAPPTCVTTTPHRLPGFQPIIPRRGIIAPPRLIDPNNASALSRQVGFIPIPDPAIKKQDAPTSNHHHHHHHRHHEHRPVEQQPQQHVSAAQHQHLHHHHAHHQRKKSSKALKNVAAIARGSGIKIVKIRRDLANFMGFGFSIKGSLEGGFGVYVSRVEETGPAWTAGLRPGDLLLAANNHPVSQMDHTEIIRLLKSSEEISLTVAATSQLSTPAVVSQSYSWVTPDTRPTSPPAQYNPHIHQHQIVTSVVNVSGANGLGLMIRGGAEYGLGIFITGVDKASAAEVAGLQVGDQILDVNGENFLSVTHDTAVSVLKYSRLLNMTLRRVAKVPHSCTTYHRRRKSSKSRRPSAEDHLSENLEATLAMIEEKSKSVLSPGAHSLLQETIAEYAAGKTPVSRLLSVAAQVLNLPDKLSLLTEIRELIRPADLHQFDSTVFNQSSALSIDREELYGVEGQCCSDVVSPSEFEEINKLIRSFHLSTEDSVEETELNFRDKPFVERSGRNFSEFIKTPSEDSGVDSTNERVIRRRKKVPQQKERKQNKFKENESNLLADFDDDGISLIQEGNEKLGKTNLKNRKVTRKKFQNKSIRDNDEFIDNYQDENISPPMCLGPQEDFEVGGLDQSLYFDPPFLGDPTLPPYSGHDIPEASLQSSYFTHSMPTMTSSYTHRFHLDLPKSQTSHGLHNHASLTSHSPIFVPALPQATSHSPIFSLQTPNVSQLHGVDVSSGDHMCLPTRDIDRHAMNFNIHRPFSDFRSPMGGMGQMGFDDHRNHKRPPRAPSDSQLPKHIGKPRIQGEHLPPPCDTKKFYARSPRAERTERARRNNFEDVLEESDRDREIEEGIMDPLMKIRPLDHRQTSVVTSDSHGRSRIIVKKTRSNLGIAIEGGRDTKQPLPRVINIAANGAAFEAGGLRVGQLILAVNGKKLEGKLHEEAARLIAGAWTDRGKSELEFLVVDKQPCDSDMRKNSLSLLSQSS